MLVRLDSERTISHQASVTLSTDYEHILVAVLGMWSILHKEDGDSIESRQEYDAVAYMIDFLSRTNCITADAADIGSLKMLLTRLRMATAIVESELSRWSALQAVA